MKRANAGLSKRELQVLELTWEGLDARDIGTRLAIHHKTVEFHRSIIREKLGAGSMILAVRRALQDGLIQCPSRRGEGGV